MFRRPMYASARRANSNARDARRSSAIGLPCCACSTGSIHRFAIERGRAPDQPTGSLLMTPAIDVHTHMLNKPWLELLREHGKPRYEVRKSMDAPEGIFLDGAP